MWNVVHGGQIEKSGQEGQVPPAQDHWGGRRTYQGEGQSVKVDDVEILSWKCARYPTPALAAKCLACGPPGQEDLGWVAVLTWGLGV